MTVSDGSLEEFVREKVAQGEYGSNSEVIQEGLRLLKLRDDLWKAKVRVKIEEGLAQARSGLTIPGEQAFVALRVWGEEQKIRSIGEQPL